MTTWSDYLRGVGKAPSTITEYQQRMRNYARWMAKRGKTLREATKADVVDWQIELVRRGNAPRTVNAKLSTLAMYYDWLLITRAIEVDPVPDGLSLRGRVPRIERLSDEQLTDILTWFDTLQANLRAAFWTMFGTGARVGEVAHLEHQDVKVIAARIYIDIKDAKWGSDRQIPVMDDRAARILYDFWKERRQDGQPLFRLSKRTIQTYATKYAKQSGVHFHAHLLRHTFATRLLESGVAMSQIQFLLGHKNISMTAHYTQTAQLQTQTLAPTLNQTVATPRLRPPTGG